MCYMNTVASAADEQSSFDHQQKMVKKVRSSKRFFRVILYQTTASGNLELPRRFVKKHGKSLSNYATLKVPTGEESKMEIERSKGQAWLHKGWADFVAKYSIKPGYFLAFRYKGGSRFNVLIFGYTTLEIAYSPSSANTCNLIEVKEEESDDEILDGRPQKILRVSGMEHGNLNRNRVTEKAKAFQSSNPYFVVRMNPTSKSILYIPKEPGRSYFGLDKGKNMMRLIGDNGRCWSMNYVVGCPPRKRVRICSGWNKFFTNTRIQEGDVCVFELVDRSSMTFKITLFRAADIEKDADKKDLLLNTTTTAASVSFKNKRVSSNIASTVMERVKNFKCSNPHFSFRATSYYLSNRPKVHIPVAHSRKYLKNEESITILDESNGKKWLVYVRSRSASVSLSKGWKDFASANQLRVGDFLVFEMMNAKPKIYKANIFRVAS